MIRVTPSESEEFVGRAATVVNSCGAVVVGDFGVYGNHIRIVNVDTGSVEALLASPLPRAYTVSVMGSSAAYRVLSVEPGYIWPLSARVESGAEVVAPMLAQNREASTELAIGCNRPLSAWTIKRVNSVAFPYARLQPCTVGSRAALPTAATATGSLSKDNLSAFFAGQMVTTSDLLVANRGAFFEIRYTPAECFSSLTAPAGWPAGLQYPGVESVRQPCYLVLRMARGDGFFDVYMIGDLAIQSPWLTPTFTQISVGQEFISLYDVSTSIVALYAPQSEEGILTDVDGFSGRVYSDIRLRWVTIDNDRGSLCLPLASKDGLVRGAATENSLQGMRAPQ